MKKQFLIITLLFLTMLGSITLKANPTKPNHKSGRPDVISITTAGDTVVLFTIKTVSYGGQYAPRHVLAMWITNSSNQYIRCLKVWASNYKSKLFKWYTYSTGTVPPDAVGGPSLTSHGTRTVVWNGKDGSGAIVPDGNYNLWVEFNETNNTGNPTISIPFTKNSTYQHVQPSNTTYFQNIDLQYFPLSTAGIEVGNDHASISVMPNPTTEQATIQVDLIKNATVQINILASNGKMVYNYAKNNYTVGKHLFLWSPKECGVSSGIYFVHVIINNQNQIYKLIVK